MHTENKCRMYIYLHLLAANKMTTREKAIKTLLPRVRMH